MKSKPIKNDQNVRSVNHIHYVINIARFLIDRKLFKFKDVSDVPCSEYANQQECKYEYIQDY